MPFKQIASPAPEYLAATDILIGDMSDTNYEFLLFDKPLILLANKWLTDNFPDIGIKVDLAGLEVAIKRSLDNPTEYHKQRDFWLHETIHQPDGQSSGRCIDIMMERAKISNPKFVFIYGGDSVRKTNLAPLFKEAYRRGLDASFVVSHRKTCGCNDTIYVAAHVVDLNIIGGYKVHFDHGLKGKGTSRIETAFKYYKDNNYFPLSDLHITAGNIGQERTKMLLGSLNARAIIGGYPKADDLIRLNTIENKEKVYRKLGFDITKPLITYAPAGKLGYDKQGGSLRDEVIITLKEIAKHHNYNVLIKSKYPRGIIILHALNKIRRMLAI